MHGKGSMTSFEPDSPVPGVSHEPVSGLPFTDRSRSLAADRPARRRPSTPFGALFDVCVRHPWGLQPLGRGLWGVDVSATQRSIRHIGSLEGKRVADVPCGRGVAFRVLRAGQEVRYLAGDPDDRMLRRAARRARRSSQTQIEFRHADLTSLPFADGEIDVFLCYGAIHAVEDGEMVVTEIARCLGPGGRLIGTAFFSDMPRRARWLFQLRARRGQPMPPSREDMYGWMAQAGLVQGTLGADRGFTGFWARKP